MKPPQDPPNSSIKPARSLDSFIPPQSFEALLARYKARMYETYADQICAIGDKDWPAFPAGGDPVQTRNEIDCHPATTGTISLQITCFSTMN